MSTSKAAVQPVDELRINDLEVLKLVFDPLRMRILEAFAGPPRTVKQVAGTLGTSPHRLYYHVNLLEQHGLLVVAETRVVSGILENHYQVAARHFIVDPTLLRFGADQDEQGFAIMLGGILDETKIDIQRSTRRGVVDLERKSPDPASLLIRRGLALMTLQQARAFHQRLRALLAEFTQMSEEEHAAGETMYALALAFYPTSALEVEPDPESDEA